MTDDASPKVTVLMSVYNGQPYLADSVESILNQTFTDFEFLIIDDGSTDDSATIIQSYRETDSRIKLIRHASNIGLTHSLNEGLDLASGEYISRQDSDDISYPQRLQNAVDILHHYDDIVMVTSAFDVIDADGAKRQSYRHEPELNLIRWHMLFYNHISAHSGVTFRKADILAYGGYDEQFRYAQDYDLWLRVLEQHKIYAIPEVLLALRMHDTSISAWGQDRQTGYANRARQRALARLLQDTTLDEEQLEALNTFWLERLPPDCSSEVIHLLLSTIYRAFINQYNPSPVVRKKIRRRCAFRFIDAAQHTHEFDERFRSVRYSFAWSIRIALGQLIRMVSSLRR